VLAGVLLTLFLALGVSQTFEELEARQSVVIYCAKVTRSLLYKSITGAHIRFDYQTFHIFCNGWIDCGHAFHTVLCL